MSLSPRQLRSKRLIITNEAIENGLNLKKEGWDIELAKLYGTSQRIAYKYVKRNYPLIFEHCYKYEEDVLQATTTIKQHNQQNQETNKAIPKVVSKTISNTKAKNVTKKVATNKATNNVTQLATNSNTNSNTIRSTYTNEERATIISKILEVTGYADDDWKFKAAEAVNMNEEQIYVFVQQYMPWFFGEEEQVDTRNKRLKKSTSKEVSEDIFNQIFAESITDFHQKNWHYNFCKELSEKVSCTANEAKAWVRDNKPEFYETHCYK
jgi:hypothetical protein